MNLKRIGAVWAVVLWLGTPDAQGFYNPNTGRWVSRDPVGDPGFWRLPRPAAVASRPMFDENGQREAEVVVARPSAWSRDVNAYGFVLNSPGNGLDVLGLYKRSGQEITVKACEIVYLFGHQDRSKPWSFTFEANAVAGAFNGCWPELTNGRVAPGYLIPGAPLHDKPEYTLPPNYVPGQGPDESLNGPIYEMIREDPDQDWKRWHEAIERGIRIAAQAACKARCCTEITIHLVNTPKKLRHTPEDEEWVWSCPR